MPASPASNSISGPHPRQVDCDSKMNVALIVSLFCCATPVAVLNSPASPAGLLQEKSGPATQPPRKGLVLGTFNVANPGGTLVADYKDPKRAVYTLRGPKLTLRSKSLDMDARSVRMVLAGRFVVEGNAEGPVRIVLRQEDGVETLHCDKATWVAPPKGTEGLLVLTGNIHWTHTGPDVEGPAEMTGSTAKITLRGGGEGPLIELDNGILNATPKERPRPAPAGKQPVPDR